MYNNQKVVLSINGNQISDLSLNSIQLPQEAANLLNNIQSSLLTQKAPRSFAPPPPPPTMSKKPRTFSQLELKADLYSLKRKFQIDEKGSFLGIKVGKTTKLEVLEIMKEYSQINYNKLYHNRVFNYDDLSLNISFDQNGIVEEINIGAGFVGQTIKGLKIGDSINKAVSLYGNPLIRLPHGAKWRNISFFLRR